MHSAAQHGAAPGGSQEVLSAAALVALAEGEDGKRPTNRRPKEEVLSSHRGVGEEKAALPALVAA